MASKFALVIANTEYQDASFAKLTAPGHDAEEFAQVLRELATFDDVQVFLNGSEGQTRRAIARFFINRKRDDLLLLYFSGHGIRNEQGHLFLAANDTEISILEASGIPAEFVTNSMNTSRSQRQLLILDCCNSGAFAHGSKSAAGVGKSMGIATAFEGSGFGRVVLTATDATQYAWEGDQVIGNTQKSVFTHFLIEGLKGEADRDGDGRIHVDELYDYTYEQIVRRTPKQTPGKWSYKQQGDIVLRDNLKPRDGKPAPLPPELSEMLAHPNADMRRAGIQELIGLLEGNHQGLARAAQEKLREVFVNDESLTLRKNADDALTNRGIVVEQSVEQASSHQNPSDVPVRRKTLPNSKISLFIGVASVIIGIPLCIVISANYAIDNLFEFATATPSPTNGITVTLTLQPNITKTPTQNVPSISPSPTLGIGSTKVSEKDGMTLIYVPEGKFTMGSNTGDSDEQPVRLISLKAFWIDRTEVTNKMYSICVGEGICQEPTNNHSSARSSYYDNSDFENYPVIYVDWNRAKVYCEWAGRRLPTEAEWEKSARGTDGQSYPWGNSLPTNDLLNYSNAIRDTTEVGSYPNGASPYSVLDMSGNVWEWVSDWYVSDYYDRSTTINPTGPLFGQFRSLRGGAWNGDFDVRASDRYWNSPSSSGNNIGFRCAVSADEQTESISSQPIATEASTPSAALDIGSTMTGQDGMTLLYVPASGFTMGSDTNAEFEKSIHTVYLDAFWIDQTEVTNRQYAMCVSVGACELPPSLKSPRRQSGTYFGNPQYEEYPVIYMDWFMARSYCEWAGRRLPTEAEWEKAARGTDGRIYPWGNDAPNGTLLNYNTYWNDTTFVRQYPNGRSPYGAFDMAGNVWEWTSSLYIPYPYDEDDGREDPSSLRERVLRGASWYFVENSSNSIFRYGVIPVEQLIRSDLRSWSDPLVVSGPSSPYGAGTIGIRCAMDATP